MNTKKTTTHARLLLGALFVLVLSMSAGLTGYFVSTRESAKADIATSSPIAASIDLFEKTAAPNTVSLQVGQVLQVNNKSKMVRELSLGAGDAHEDTHDDATESHETDHSMGSESHDHHKGFTSGEFAPDEAWRATFSQAGTYFLHDHENPEVNILVVVYDANTDFSL